MENLRQVQVLINPSRRVMVNGKHEGNFTENRYELGIFHKWEDYKSDEISEVRAVVEFEDGRVESFSKALIKFTNRPVGSNILRKD